MPDNKTPESPPSQRRANRIVDLSEGITNLEMTQTAPEEGPLPDPQPSQLPADRTVDLSEGITKHEMTSTAPEEGPLPDPQPSDSSGGETSAPK